MHMCVCVMCRVDVTEGQFGVMFVYCITALFGPDLWDVEVSCHLTKLFSKHCLSIFRCICLSNRWDWRHLCIHAYMHAWSKHSQMACWWLVISALTLFVGWQEERPACNNIGWGIGMVVFFWSEMQSCIWSRWCHCHSIISCFSKIQNVSSGTSSPW